MPKAIIILAALNLLDAVMTWVCIYSGHFEEANPILRPYMNDATSMNMFGVMCIKTMLSICLIFLAKNWWRFKDWHHNIWTPLIVTAFVIYIITTINNTFGIVQWLLS